MIRINKAENTKQVLETNPAFREFPFNVTFKVDHRNLEPQVEIRAKEGHTLTQADVQRAMTMLEEAAKSRDDHVTQAAAFKYSRLSAFFKEFPVGVVFSPLGSDPFDPEPAEFIHWMLEAEFMNIGLVKGEVLDDRFDPQAFLNAGEATAASGKFRSIPPHLNGPGLPDNLLHFIRMNR